MQILPDAPPAYRASRAACKFALCNDRNKAHRPTHKKMHSHKQTNQQMRVLLFSECARCVKCDSFCFISRPMNGKLGPRRAASI